MGRCLGSVLLVAFCASVLAEEQLPSRDGEESLDIEPPLLIHEGKPLPPLPEASPVPNSPEQIALTLERARRNAAAGERLFKAGILAKVQAEERTLKVIRLEDDYAQAQLGAAKEERAEIQQKFERGEVSRPVVDAAGAAIAKAEEAARVVKARRDQAEVEAARVNLQRQQKLLALGSAHKSDVNRAQEKLAELMRR